MTQLEKAICNLLNKRLRLREELHDLVHTKNNLVRDIETTNCYIEAYQRVEGTHLCDGDRSLVPKKKFTIGVDQRRE